MNLQLQAIERAGWVDQERSPMTHQTLDLMRMADRGMGTLVAKATLLGLCDEREEDVERGVLEMTPNLVKAAWQSLKRGFKGRKGKAAFWAALGVLAMDGRIQGEFGRSPKDGDWMELAARVMGKSYQVREPSKLGATLVACPSAQPGATKEGQEPVASWSLRSDPRREPR